MRWHYNKMNICPHVLNLTDYSVLAVTFIIVWRLMSWRSVQEESENNVLLVYIDGTELIYMFARIAADGNQEGKQNGEQCRHWPSPTALTGGAGVEFVEEPGRGDRREPAELSADEGWLWGQLTDFHGPSQLTSICSILYFSIFFGFC